MKEYCDNSQEAAVQEGTKPFNLMMIDEEEKSCVNSQDVAAPEDVKRSNLMMIDEDEKARVNSQDIAVQEDVKRSNLLMADEEESANSKQILSKDDGVCCTTNHGDGSKVTLLQIQSLSVSNSKF